MHFTLNPVIVRLLHLVTEVDEQFLRNLNIYKRSLWRPVPWYRSSKGGGAITLGSSSWQSMVFTENFFSADKTKYGEKAYGDDVRRWMMMLAHEACHIHHARRFGFFIYYLLRFAFEYLVFGHDKSPLEKEADAGVAALHAFHQHVYRFGVIDLFDYLLSSVPEQDKMRQLEEWWKGYLVSSF